MIISVIVLIFVLFIVHCSEPPYFLRRPEDSLAVAGSDTTLSCQVGGQSASLVPGIL